MASTPVHLYVIGERVGSLVKIGRARDVDRRLREIQTGYPRDLSILHVEWCAGRLESCVHQALAQWHCRGEWFDFGERDPVSEVRAAVCNAEHAESPRSRQQRLFAVAIAETFGGRSGPPPRALQDQ